MKFDEKTAKVPWHSPLNKFSNGLETETVISLVIGKYVTINMD